MVFVLGVILGALVGIALGAVVVVLLVCKAAANAVGKGLRW